MEDFDKYLDRLVENFYDTGKLILESKLLTNDELRKIALKYLIKSEWVKNDSKSYNQARNRNKIFPGFWRDITSHMKSRSLTNDELRKIAKKYRTKGEWLVNDKNSYAQAYKRDKNFPNFFSDITSDMEVIDLSKKHIYAYEFYNGKDPIAVYVGLTCDMTRRKKEHVTGYCAYGKKETAVFKFIKENPNLSYEVVMLEPEPLYGKDAQDKEEEWEKKYRDYGWVTLNKTKTGSLGMPRKYSDDNLRKIAKKYNGRNEWKSNDFHSWDVARKRKDLYKNITSHMQYVYNQNNDTDSDGDQIPNRLDKDADGDGGLDEIIENFFDTGKLVLNENYWVETVNIISDLRNNPQTVDELLNRYDSIRRGVYGPRIGELNGLMVNGELNGIEVVDFIEGLKNGVVDIEQYEDDGVIFPEEETDTEEVDNDLDNSVDPLNSDDYFHRNTSVTTQNKRKEHIEKSNISNLKILSIEYDGDTEDKIYVSNLKTLQYILLNSSKLGIDGDDRKELIEEIKSSKFGKKTEEVLKYFQGLNEVEPTGVTDDNTWEKLMEILEESENSKLGNIDEVGSEVTDRIKNYNKINDEGVSEDKKNLFYGLSLKLFNNLVDKELYSNIEKKQWDSYKADFESNLKKFKKEDGKVTTIKNLNKEIEDIKKGKSEFNVNQNLNTIGVSLSNHLKKHYDDPLSAKVAEMSELINGVLSKGKRNYKVNKEGKEFWSDYISRYNQTDQRQNIENEYVDYRNQESVEFLHEKVIDSLKKSLEDKKISIDEVNEVIFSVNDAIYEVYSGDQMDRGKKDKIKGVLKDIINDINLEGDIYEIIDGLQNINVRKIAGDVYEKSFCGCNTDSNSYFIGCNSRAGDQSELFPETVQKMKTYLDGDNSTSGSTQSAKQIYELIINTATTKANKYDIISKTDVTLTNGVIIPNDKKIEVKKYDEQNEYTLSEFIGLYKKSKDKETYRKQNINYFNKYNEIIEEVVRLLNENDNGLANSFKGEDKMYGVFVGDYNFYKHDQIDLKWSTQSDQNRGSDELRLTLKFSIKGDQLPSQWVEGNCNLQQNESTDRLDEIIENFFDTGKFVI